MSISYTLLHFMPQKMDAKLSQILSEILRVRKAATKGYTILDLANEFHVSESMMKKYLSGDFDKSDRLEGKKKTAIQLLNLAQMGVTPGDDVTLLSRLEVLEEMVEINTERIGELEGMILRIQNKLL